MRIERIGGMGGICGICCKALIYKGLFVPPAFHLHFLPWNLAFQGNIWGIFAVIVGIVPYVDFESRKFM